MVENKNVGADSISARTQAAALRAHIECAPTMHIFLIHRIYYFLFILYYLSTAHSASRLMIA